MPQNFRLTLNPLRARPPRRIFVAMLALLAFASCSTRRQVAVVPPPAGADRTYIDLQPGWRLFVITPILRSGGYVVQSARTVTEAGSDGRSLNITVEAGPDFLGLERSYYSVDPRNARDAERSAGVRVRFQSAEKVVDGKTAAQQKPMVQLFNIPRRARYVRLLYLVRSSQADHNMAVLAAADPARLAELTAEVRRDPRTKCRESDKGYCSWIPAGIAVRPEMRRTGLGDWVPSR